MTVMHESRLWSGKDKEKFEHCTCEEAPCGYVIPNSHCNQHSMTAGKSLRRAHREQDCGGVNHEARQQMAQPDHHGPVRTER